MDSDTESTSSSLLPLHNRSKHATTSFLDSSTGKERWSSMLQINFSRQSSSFAAMSVMLNVVALFAFMWLLFSTPSSDNAINANSNNSPSSSSSCSSSSSPSSSSFSSPVVLSHFDACKGSTHILPYEKCYSNEYAREIQLSYITDSRVNCDEAGLCHCPAELFFNGRECLPMKGSVWEAIYHTLENKWHEAPFNSAGAEAVAEGDGVVVDSHDNAGRVFTENLLKLSDADLIKYWEAGRETYLLPMWYTTIGKGQYMMDIGSGLGPTSLQFAMNGARVTYVDVVKYNLQVIERICTIKGIRDRVHFIHLTDVAKLKSDLKNAVNTHNGGFKYDVISAFGSMHHAPHELISRESVAYFDVLKLGGKWIQLSYPISRWVEGGAETFDIFGKQTDGERTPWGEWSEPGKLINVYKPNRLVLNWCGILYKDVNWFEFTYLGNEKNSVTLNDIAQDADKQANAWLKHK